MNTKTCRVLVVDDQDALRLLVRGIVKKMGLEVVGEASDGQGAVEQYSQLKPDLVLLDINMPFKSGLDALREIVCLDDKARVVMLTSVAEMDMVKECLAAGALNYVLKTNPVDNIRAVIQQALDEE